MKEQPHLDKIVVVLGYWVASLLSIAFLMALIAWGQAIFNPCHAQDLIIPGMIKQSYNAETQFYYSRRCFYRSLSLVGKFSGPDRDAYALRVQCSPGYEQIKNPQIKSLPHGNFRARFNSQGLFWGYRIVVGVKRGKVRGIIK